MHPPLGRPYADRDEAGTVLAELLARRLAGDRAGWDRLLVLGLPRGGVPVAAPVARRLAAPLDVLLVRKVGLPGRAELAMGAVAAIGSRTAVVANHPVLRQHGVPPAEFDAACRAELDTLGQQAIRYRGQREALELAGRPVVVVDDGLATGATVRAAAAMLRAAGAGRLALAVPIGSGPACQALAAEVDVLVCPWQPLDFRSVSQAYRDFGQTSDATVIRLLAESG
ncbi:MAG: putative phosphoribosyl transferase [Pseudonocardiales bacterium]|nr:putative phosphoribosyl transferase [Pseudonocardiales bacterium]